MHLPVLPETKPKHCGGKAVTFRPCPYAYQCRYHMFELKKGDKKYTDDELADILLNLPVTCMWDVWEHGKVYNLATIGSWFRFTGNMVSNMTRELFAIDAAARDKLKKVFDMFYTDCDES